MEIEPKHVRFLSKLWNNFLLVSPEAKNLHLEKFIDYYLNLHPLLTSPRPKEFNVPWNSVIQHICHHLTSEIVTIGDHDAQPHPPSLKHFFLSSLGWKSLYLLLLIGVEDIDCSESFVDIIIAALLEFLYNYQEETPETNDIFESLPSSSFLKISLPSIDDYLCLKFSCRSQRDLHKHLVHLSKPHSSKHRKKIKNNLTRFSISSDEEHSILPKLLVVTTNRGESNDGDDELDNFDSQECIFEQNNFPSCISLEDFYLILLWVLHNILKKNNVAPESQQKGFDLFMQLDLLIPHFPLKKKNNNEILASLLLRIGLVAFSSLTKNEQNIGLYEQTLTHLLRSLNKFPDSISHSEGVKVAIYLICKFSQEAINTTASLEESYPKAINLVKILTFYKVPELIVSTLQEAAGTSANVSIINLIRDAIVSLKSLQLSFSQLNKGHSEFPDALNLMLHHYEWQPSPSEKHNKSNFCCIATLCLPLLQLFAFCDDLMFTYLVKDLSICGICCCLPLDQILLPLLNGLDNKRQFKERLHLIENVILKGTGHTSFTLDHHSISCPYCSNEEDATTLSLSSMEDSGISDNSSQEIMNVPISHNVVFSKYRDLLNDSNLNFSNAIGHHLYRVTLMSSHHFRYQLFRKIFLTELLSKAALVKSLKNFLPLNYTLLIMNSLLRDCKILKTFTNSNGLKSICELLHIEEVLPYALGSFEVVMLYSPEPHLGTCTSFLSLLIEKSRSHIQSEISSFEHHSCSIDMDPVKEEGLQILKCKIPPLQLIWEVCQNLVLHKIPFKEHLESSQEFFPLSFQLYLNVLNDIKSTRVEKRREIVEYKLKLLEAILKTCLNIVHPVPSPWEKELASFETLRTCLGDFHPTHLIHLRMVLNLCLNCCHTQHSSEGLSELLAKVLNLNLNEDEHLDSSLKDCSRGSTASATQDEGYEADEEIIDISYNKWTKQQHDSVKLHRQVDHPQLLIIWMDLLCHYHKLHFSLNANQWLNAASLILQDFRSFLQNFPSPFKVAKDLKLNESLKNCFEDVMKTSKSEFRDFQQVLADLCFELFHHSCMPEDVTFLLSFFKPTNAPLDVLMTCLHKLVEKTKIQPSAYVTFPVNHPLTDTTAPLYQSLSHQSDWSPLQNFFSLSLWIAPFSGYPQTAPESTANKLFHVVSLGSSQLLFQIWLNILEKAIVVRFDNSTTGVIAEAECLNVVSLESWQHVGINLSRTFSSLKDVEVQVDLIVNGTSRQTLLFNLTHPTSRPEESFLLLGHRSPDQESPSHGYHLATTFIFKDRVLTPEICYYLSRLGPDVTHLTSSILDTAFFFLPSAFPPAASQEIDPLVLTGIRTPSLQLLQENLLVSFSPHLPDRMLLYPKVLSPNYAFFHSFAATSPDNFKIVSSDPRCSQHQPIQKSFVSSLLLKSTFVHDLPKSIVKLGGVSLPLFLLAKVVEGSSSPKTHAQALSFLFHLLALDSTLASQFHSQEGYFLIAEVLKRSPCLDSPPLVQTYINMALRGPLSGCLISKEVSGHLVVNSRALKHLVTLMASCHSSRPIQDFLNHMAIMVDPLHPHASFNVNQLRSVKLLDQLLFVIKDIYLVQEGYSLSEESIEFLMTVIYHLLVSKLNFWDFKMVFSTLLLLQDSATTYVSNSRTSSYFHFGHHFEQDLVSHTESDTASTFSTFYAQSSSLRRKSSPSTRKTPEPLEGWAVIHVSDNVPEIAEEDVSPCPSPSPTHCSVSLTPNADLGLDASSYDFTVNLQSRKTSRHPLTTHGIRTEMCYLLCSFLENADSRVIESFLDKVAFWKELVVMASTPSPTFCLALLKLLKVWLQKAPVLKVSEFYKMKGYHLLASQFSNLGLVSADLINFSFSLAVGTNVTIEASTEIHYKEETAQPLFFTFVFALLPFTAHHPSLCKDTLRALSSLWERLSYVQLIWLELGFVESLGKLFIKLCDTVNAASERAELINEVIYLFGLIGIFLISNGGPIYWQEYLNLVHFLSGLERNALDGNPLFISYSRDCQCQLFQKSLRLIREIFFQENEPGTSSSNTKWNNIFPGHFSRRIPSLPPTIPDNLAILPELRRMPKIVKYKEVTDRMLWLLVHASDFIIHRTPKSFMSSQEVSFIVYLLNFLFRASDILLEKARTENYKRRTVLINMKETVQNQLTLLLTCCLEPTQPQECHHAILDFIIHSEFQLLISPKGIPKLLAFLQFIKFHNKGALDSNKLEKLSEYIYALKTQMEQSQMRNLDFNKEYQEHLCQVNEKSIKWHRNIQKDIKKSFSKHEALFCLISSFGSQVTEDVTMVINQEKKKFFTELRQSYHDNMMARRRWQAIIDQITHERAPWYIEEFYPQFWEIDPTEGPSRVRKRLQRCFLNLSPRFLKEECRHTLENRTSPRKVLSYLFEAKDPRSDSSLLIENLLANEKISYISTCVIVTPSADIEGEILLGEQCLYFVGDTTKRQIDVQSDPVLNESGDPFVTNHVKELFSQAWPYSDIKEILQRRYLLKENAIEIFLVSGMTYLLTFDSKQSVERLWDHLVPPYLPGASGTHQPTNLAHAWKDGHQAASITQSWRDGHITNFQYLTQLNKLAGRTFNDLMQYPVFPFVLSDYSSQALDLSNPNVYRNLACNVAVQNKEREKHFKSNYEDLLEDPGLNPLSGLSIAGPYHFSSLYSNSGLVLQYLIRLLPFTYKFLKFQDNNFDVADRSFHSLQVTWRVATKDSTSDVKEMIPEFFYLPEVFLNSNGFDLGICQNGVRVDDVELPPWCDGDARLFVLVNRQALESELVTLHLHQWIDLIFGYKQTGKAAVAAVNVYPPVTYYDGDITQIGDELSQKAVQTMIRNLGQVPLQLFTSPHPMVALNLASQRSSDSKGATIAVGKVTGLRWGHYVGSPAAPTPFLSSCRSVTSQPLGSLVALINNDVFWLVPHACLLLAHNQTKGLLNSTYVESAALIAWNHPDGVVRIKFHPKLPHEPLFSAPSFDQVCICHSVPDCPLLFVGFSSGLVKVYSLHFDPVKGKVVQKKPSVTLIGHQGAVTAIAISPEFSIAATSSQDCTIILWDLNKLSYVRSIRTHKSRVNLVCVSPTLGDIASTSTNESGNGSVLQVHTINASPVATTTTDAEITSLCYSTLPEGTAINVIGAGLSSGVIKLFSSWDLSPVKEISANIGSPIISLTYSQDNQHLFAATDQNRIYTWEVPSRSSSSRKPKFKDLLT